MVEEDRGSQTAVENRKKRGWQVHRSVAPSESTSKQTLSQLRQLGFVRLVKTAARDTGTEMTSQSHLPPTAARASLHMGGESMPKRQHQVKRDYKDDDSRRPENEHKPAIADIPTVKREFILTPSTDETLFEAVRLLSKGTGTNLTNSHFLRVVLKCIAHAMPQLEREASELGQLQRPSNARENQSEREEYERTIAAAVTSALRRCPPFESEPRPKTKGPRKPSG